MKEYKKLKLDSKGYELLKEEIEETRQKLNEARLYKGKVAIHQGDNWHDNPSLYQTEQEEYSLMVKLAELQQLLENIEIIESLEDSPLVDINDVVKVNMIFDENDMEQQIYRLVARKHPDINGNISEIALESPLGASIYRQPVGSRVSYSVNNAKVVVDILEKIDLSKEDPYNRRLQK